ncbi:magnesium transporter [Ketobacter sp.]|uniref:magnesium transporter n=1 Tax=Ketobacter sp. TaxID=2083498 RepID=UPI000F27514E|nr:magnesium transporter [Ketobacter sp.]RLT94498.1 MAG: magnesium transporter [Ketobacter sp.]
MTQPDERPKKLATRLAPVLEQLQRQTVVESVTHRQQQQRADLIENLVQRQQRAALVRELNKLNKADIGHLLNMLPADKRHTVWAELPNATAAGVLLELNDAVAEDLIDLTAVPRLLSILECLDSDELTEIDDLIPAAILQQAINALEANERRWVTQTIAYPEGTVGDNMSRDSLTIAEQATINEAIERVRSAPELPPQTDKLFVINRHRQLVGIVPLVELMRHPGEVMIRDCMDTDVVSFAPNDDAEDAGQAFERYDLISAPVVDEQRRLIGRLRVETIMDYLREVAESQALAKEGLKADTDLFGPILEGARERWPWLVINLFTAFLATRFISLFEGTIEQLVALATLMPIVASVGGNTGNQTAALVIRGLAMEQIQAGNLGYVYRKELVISLLNGTLWGSLLGVFAWLLYGNPLLGAVMMAAVTLNLLLAALIGISVPLLLDRLHKDPAMGSSVVLTFATDSMGFFLFLGLATLILV